MRFLNGTLFAKMIQCGAAKLQAHKKEVNDLNVFPIPDGDTGDNMLMTVTGGIITTEESSTLDEVTNRVANEMLLSARGNSGVILSQFFEGIKKGCSGLKGATVRELEEAFKKGVDEAYSSVMTPTEGTVLTVMREATEYAIRVKADTVEDFLTAFISEAKRSLERTPELLPVLKNAGVVDSGAAGFIYIAEGMLLALSDDSTVDTIEEERGPSDNHGEIDINAFTEDSILEYGYCTELLVRLQKSKVNLSDFDEAAVTNFLLTVGESVVIVRNGSLLKIHIHTFTPDKVLAFCQGYGEFLKVKIENMSLQHNDINAASGKSENTAVYRAEDAKPRKKFGTVAVVSGEGLAQLFYDLGADEVVNGGQCSNPSTEELISAIYRANADTVFVFPNNSNIILTAKQASELCKDVDVRVLEAHTVGEGYAALSMYTDGYENADEIYAELCDAMSGSVTAQISRCVRDAQYGDGVTLHSGEYIGFVGKDILATATERITALKALTQKIDANQYDVCILIFGKDTPQAEAEEFKRFFLANYRGKEFYSVDGGQDVYDYILIFE